MNDISKSYYKFHLDKWGKPQQYKSIELHPILLIDEDYYTLFSKLMCHNKNIIADRDILKMSYLKFVIYVLSASWKEEVYLDLIKLLEYITKQKVDVKFENINYPPESYSDIKLYLDIGGELITEVEFDYIREMILHQNGLSIEYVNEYDPSLEESLNFINRNSNLTLEEQIFSFVAEAGQPINKFSDYTFYQFQKHFGRLSLNVEYKAFKPLEVSGQISFKNGGQIDHWLTHTPEKGRYSDILIKKESYVNDSDIFKSSKTI